MTCTMCGCTHQFDDMHTLYVCTDTLSRAKQHTLRNNALTPPVNSAASTSSATSA